MYKTLNFAHRGFRSKFPENTMLAFSKAAECGVHGIEFDVQLSADGVPVIIHDETADRTCAVSGFIKDKTFAELRRLNAAATFRFLHGQSPTVEKIPSLEEYFDFIKDKDIISNIELKNSVFEYKGIEQIVCSLLKKYRLVEKCIISSFNHESILRVKSIAPSLMCGFLTDAWDISPAAYLKAHNVECYHPAAYRLSKDFVDTMHREGLKVNAWFGSVQTSYKDVLKTGIDAIITDNPDIVARLIKS